MTTRLFIVGTGRCGTVTLWRILQSVPRTFALHEGVGVLNGDELTAGPMLEVNHTLYHQAEERQKLFERSFDPTGDLYREMLHGFGPRRCLIRYCRANDLHYCDVNPYQYNLINFIHLTYPDAKFVHVVRNGYDCVRSFFQRTKSTYPDQPKAGWSRYSMAKPMPMDDDPWFDEWNDFDRLQKIAWMWTNINALIQERLQRVSRANQMILKLEEFSEQRVLQLLEFAGLPRQFDLEQLRLHNAQSELTLQWTSESIAAFNRIAGAQMKRFQYEVRGER